MPKGWLRRGSYPDNDDISNTEGESDTDDPDVMEITRHLSCATTLMESLSDSNGGILFSTKEVANFT